MTKTSSKIWRTVVVAGAMLATPACGKDKPAQTTPTTQADPAPDDGAAKAAADKQAQEDADKKAAEEAAAKEEADKKAAEELAAKEAEEEAARKAAEEEAAKKRPRGGNARPVGRGFVLA